MTDHAQGKAFLLVDEGILNTVNWLNNLHSGYAARTLYSCEGGGPNDLPYITWVVPQCVVEEVGVNNSKKHNAWAEYILGKLTPYGVVRGKPGEKVNCVEQGIVEGKPREYVGTTLAYHFQFASKEKLKEFEEWAKADLDRRIASR